MSIYKFNFTGINPPEIVSSSYFKSMFSKQQEEYKQIYEILYNLYAETNILSYHEFLNDINISDYIKNLDPNKTVLQFKNIDQVQLDETLNGAFNNAVVDQISDVLVSKKVVNKRYDISKFYDITMASANNDYLTKPTEIYSNQAIINENILSVVYEYNPSDIINFTSLILDIKKTNTTDVLNTIILATYPTNYSNYLYLLTQGKNKEKTIISSTNRPYVGGNTIFNNYDYSSPYYLSINDSYLDYVKFDLRTRSIINQSDKKIGLIGIKNIYFESNTYAKTSHYAFKLFDTIERKTNKIQKIKLINKSYSPLVYGNCSIRLYESLEKLYSNYSTPLYDSNFYSTLAPANGINVTELTDDTICLIILNTDNIRSTNIIKEIEIIWENI